MMNTILVPLDGSTVAEQAVSVAAKIARATGAKLVLVRVVDAQKGHWSKLASQDPKLSKLALTTDLEDAFAYLRQFAKRVDGAGITVYSVVRCGAVVPTLLSIVASYHADMIVMTRHGQTEIVHGTLGDVATQMVGRSPVPILMLGEHVAVPTTQTLTALLPMDCSTQDLTAIEPAATVLAALAVRGQQCRIHLTHVVPQYTPAVLVRASAFTRAKLYMKRVTELMQNGFVAPSVTKSNLITRWSVVYNSSVANGILEQVYASANDNVEEQGCNVLVISTSTNGDNKPWKMGDVTENILQKTLLPVLFVRAKDVSRQAEDVKVSQRVLYKEIF